MYSFLYVGNMFQGGNGIYSSNVRTKFSRDTFRENGWKEKEKWIRKSIDRYDETICRTIIENVGELTRSRSVSILRPFRTALSRLTQLC